MQSTDFNAKIVDFITSYVRNAGRDKILIGFADIDDINELASIDTELPRAISIAVPLEPEVVASVEKGPSQLYYEEDKAIHRLLEDLATAVGQFLEEEGFAAKSIPPFALNSDDDAQFLHDSYAPNKIIACYSGLGWMGKCGLVVTKPFGTANRLVSIFTDVPVNCSKKVFLSRCGRCNECITACEAGALSGADWNPSLHAVNLIDAEKCRNACREKSLEAFGIATNLCGICMHACPYTKAYLKRNGYDPVS